MKKLIWLVFVVLFLAFVPTFPSGISAYAGSEGSQETPIPITNCFELQQMNANLTASYILINDIDCSDTANWNSGAGFVPIGSQASPFIGTLDGQNHKITGLFINRPSTDYVGLFGYTVGGAIIKNVSLVNVNIAGSHYVGGLVGYLNIGGSIINSYETGSVTGMSFVGGLVGLSIVGSIINSFETGSVTGGYFSGGLVGYNVHGTITNSYASGGVRGQETVGGLVGDNYFGTITNCYATGSVTSVDYGGGLVGSNWGTITNCYAIGSVTGTNSVGGLVGRDMGREYGGTITNSYWDTETSCQSTSAGGTGKTTAEMLQPTNFVGWDFINIWTIQEGVTYPYFLWQIPPVPVDNIPPVIASHNDEFAETTSPAGTFVYYVLPIASDNNDTSVIVTCTPASGSTFALGDTTVTCTAVDAAGNQATPTSFIVHVVDTTPPTIYVSAPECVPYGKGNGNIANKITVTAQDNCSKSVIPLITKVEVFNNGGNLVNGNGIYEISENTVYINPIGNGWYVRITAFAADEKGNPRTSQITKYLIKC